MLNLLLLLLLMMIWLWLHCGAANTAACWGVISAAAPGSRLFLLL